MSQLPKIFILILNWNNKEDTIKCIQSVQKISYPSFETVIIDNGSKDGSSAAFKTKFPSIPLIENQENLGYAEGNNVGIRYAIKNGADAVLILNNDAIVDKDLLTHFVAATQEKKDGGIFGAKVMNFKNPHQAEHFGGNWNPSRCEFVPILDGADIQKVDYVSGCAFFIQKQVIETIGYLEPKFFLLWEESDYCIRAKQKGFVTYSVKKALIWHKVSASFTGGKPQMHYFWWRNRLFWVRRNLSKKEKRRMYRAVLLPEMIKIYKLRVVKSLEMFLMFFFLSKEKREKKLLKLNRYKAGCRGIQDYFLNRMGNTY